MLADMRSAVVRNVPDGTERTARDGRAANSSRDDCMRVCALPASRLKSLTRKQKAAPRMGASSEALLIRREWQPRQPHPGTRVACCRCFLPDLAEFTSYRREGTDEATIRRFQAPVRYLQYQTPSGMYSAHPVPHPSGSLRCTHGRPAHASNPPCLFSRVRTPLFDFGASTDASVNNGFKHI